MLEKYAELLVKQGVNLQPGQELVIDSSIECFELVRAVAKVAYEVGAKDVIVNYTDEKISRHQNRDARRQPLLPVCLPVERD